MGQRVVNEEKMRSLRRDLDKELGESKRFDSQVQWFCHIIFSEREQLEITKTTYENAVRRLEKEEELIGKKTSALAILYKNKCLVDKSKSDAVKIYLDYQIKKAETAGKHKEANELKQEPNKHVLF